MMYELSDLKLGILLFLVESIHQIYKKSFAFRCIDRKDEPIFKLNEELTPPYNTTHQLCVLFSLTNFFYTTSPTEFFKTHCIHFIHVQYKFFGNRKNLEQIQFLLNNCIRSFQLARFSFISKKKNIHESFAQPTGAQQGSILPCIKQPVAATTLLCSR